MVPCCGFLPLPKETTDGSEPRVELMDTTPSCFRITVLHAGQDPVRLAER